MRILRKILFIVLALLPLCTLIFYGINMISDGASFSDITVHEIIDTIIEDLRTNTPNSITNTFNDLFENLDDYIPISNYVLLAVAYLVYLFVVEMMLFIYDLLVFVPRKCSEIFIRGV